MISKVTKATCTYFCTCGETNVVKLKDCPLPDSFNSLSLPACKTCGVIRVISLDPVENVHGRPHPGLDLLHHRHTRAAIQQIHGEALGVALGGGDPKKVYKAYLDKV